MKPKSKTIMNSHEYYIKLLTTQVKDYSMSELEAMEKRTRNSNAYRETNKVYLEEIERRKIRIGRSG